MKPLFVEKKSHGFAIFLIIIAIVLAVSLVIFDNNRVVVTQQPITYPVLPKEIDGYAILNISDLCGRRFGAQQKDLLASINAQKYNALIFTGNLTAEDGDPEPFYEILDGLTRKDNIYFITGAQDPSEYQSDDAPSYGYADWIRGAMDRGATFLEKPEPIKVGESTLWIFPGYTATLSVPETLAMIQTQIAEQSSASGDPMLLKKAQFNLAKYQAIQQAQAMIQEQDIKIAVFKRPLHAGSLVSEWMPVTTDEPDEDDAPDDATVSVAEGVEATQRFTRETDLVIAGGYMGGPHCLPFLGPIHVDDPMLGARGWFPPKDRVSGLTDIDGVRQYIPRGLGARVKPKFLSFRLFNTPEISRIELTTKWSESSSPTMGK